MAKTRRVSNRAKLAEQQQIILPDAVRVIRESEIAEWVVSGNHSVKAAAAEFSCSTTIVRQALASQGYMPVEQKTLWARDEDPPEADE